MGAIGTTKEGGFVALKQMWKPLSERLLELITDWRFALEERLFELFWLLTFVAIIVGGILGVLWIFNPDG